MFLKRAAPKAPFKFVPEGGYARFEERPVERVCFSWAGPIWEAFYDMRITLVHNPSAGNTKVSGLELTRILNKAGHSVVYVPLTGADLDRALEAATDLVVGAGGDGIVARVATQINRACPIASLPVGNANNIAKSLGAYGAFDKLISSWTAAAARAFHLIAAQGLWGSRRLVEGLGIGALTCALERMSGNKPSASLARDVIRRVLKTAAPHDLDMYLDANHITGRFAILEVTTIALVGTNLLLARNANPSHKDLKVCALG
jgi:diacylglycerol kinase (ATP)